MKTYELVEDDDTETDEFPLTQGIVWTRLAKGYVVTYVEIEGSQVVVAEGLSEVPEKAEAARQRIAVESAVKFAKTVAERGLKT